MNKMIRLGLFVLAVSTGIAFTVRVEAKASPSNAALPSASDKAAAKSMEHAPLPKTGTLPTGKILLPATADYTWWAADATGRVLQAPKSIKADSIDWSGDFARIYVLNDGTGNAAIIQTKDSKDDETKLVDADFRIARRVKVRVSAKSGQPVKTASVILKDASGAIQQKILGASERGAAEFEFVPTGKATITAGSADVKVTQEVSVDRDRKEAVPAFEVILTGDVPTVKPERAKPEPVKEKPKTSPGNNPFAGVISLLLLAALAYIVYLILKSRNITLKGTLERAGIPLEENMPEAVPAATSPAAPSLDPDMVGPAPGASPSLSSNAPAPAVSGPKLVGLAGTYAGAVFPLTGASVVVGRETTCDIALPDDHTASRRHARFINASGTIIVHDEGSSNGTLVNGQKILEHELSTGDEVQVGSTRFRFEV